jgi:hypothetical protein
MTIIEMKGGLGNQLFQFAAGLRRVKGDFGALFFNVSYYERDARHGGFLLDKIFPSFKFRITGARGFSQPTGYLNLDQLPDINPESIFDVSWPLYLSGYFQNYKIVEPSLPILRKMFVENEYMMSAREQLGVPILGKRRPVVGIHLRRGDYLKAENRNVHGITPLSAVSTVLSEELMRYRTYNEARFIFFSDSKELISNLGFEVYIPASKTANEETDLEEFCAMSCCDTLICSNSSFSYWAGLLSPANARMWLPSIWMKNGGVSTKSLLFDRCLIYQVKLE